MSTSERTAVPSWLILLALVRLVGPLRVMTIARGASAEASRDASLLTTADLGAALVPGGPESLADGGSTTYRGAVDAIEIVAGDDVATVYSGVL